MSKPQHLGSGVEQALVSCFKGFQEGITGLFKLPYLETKEEGLTGFLSGSLKGIVGVVAKPISGILDATSKAAEGISNTVTILDDKPSQRRVRYPRVFYNIQDYFAPYNHADSELQLLMWKHKANKFRNQIIVSSTRLQSYYLECILVLTMEYLFFYNLTEKSMILKKKIAKISSLSVSNQPPEQDASENQEEELYNESLLGLSFSLAHDDLIKKK